MEPLHSYGFAATAPKQSLGLRRCGHWHRTAPQRTPVSLACRSSQQSEANTSSSTDRAEKAMRSLDSLLGSLSSADEEDMQPSTSERPRLVEPVQGMGVNSSNEPTIDVGHQQPKRFGFARSYQFKPDETIAPPKGPEAGEHFVDLMVNDHLAASDGEVYRFITCTFMHPDAKQLFVMLLALATLSAELESLIGYGAFMAVYFSTVLSASALDAALGNMPVTQGSSPAVAGMVAALIVHLAKNWDFDLLVADAKQPKGQAAPAATVQKFDIVKGVFEVMVVIQRELRVLFAFAGAAAAALQALADVGKVDTYTSAAGLLGGFIVGGVMAWGMSPRYQVTRQALGATDSNDTATAGEANGDGGDATAQPNASSPATAAEEEVVVVADQTTGFQRGLVAVGYNIAMAAGVLGWLNWVALAE